MRAQGTALAVVAVAAFGGAAPATGQHSEHPAAQVQMTFSAFTPGSLDVLTGDTVTWRNDSVRVHTVTARDESWDSGRVVVGETFRRRFEAAGPNPYFCRLHVFGGEVNVHQILLDRPDGASGPGRARRLTGRTVLPQGSSVVLESDTGSGFAPAGTATVKTGGAFSLEVTPRETATYRAVAGEQVSPPVRVVVLDRRVAISARARGRRTLVRVAVTPSSPGATAVLQLRLRHRFGWWPVAKARLNRASRTTFAIPRGRRVKARVVLTLPDGATPTAVSRSVTVGSGSRPARRQTVHSPHGSHR